MTFTFTFTFSDDGVGMGVEYRFPLCTVSPVLVLTQVSELGCAAILRCKRKKDPYWVGFIWGSQSELGTNIF